MVTNPFAEGNPLVLECWSGSTHVLDLADSQNAAHTVPDLLAAHFPNDIKIHLIVIDPPYGTNKAPWDSQEKGREWAEKIIPELVASLTKDFAQYLTPDFKLLIFHQLDNPNFWVCLVYSFLTFSDHSKIFAQRRVGLQNYSVDQGYDQSQEEPICQQLQSDFGCFQF